MPEELVGALVGGAANGTHTRAHSHQPADRASPAPGVNEQNHRLSNSILRLAVAQLAASISDLITRAKSARCPFHRTSFYCRGLSAWRAPHGDPLAAKIRDRRSRGPGRGTGQVRRGTGALGLGQLTKAMHYLASRVAPSPPIRAPIVLFFMPVRGPDGALSDPTGGFCNRFSRRSSRSCC
jgi:hypothetical protein